VKNLALADGDAPEPLARVVGEQQVGRGRRPARSPTRRTRPASSSSSTTPTVPRVVTVAPGVDLEHFRPARPAAPDPPRRAPDAVLLLFVGRIQPLKAPDVLLHAAARMLEHDPSLRARLVVAVVGGPSGTGLLEPTALQDLAHASASPTWSASSSRGEPTGCATGTAPPTSWRCPATTSPSAWSPRGAGLRHPVVATDVGGLRTTVRDGVSGLLVPGHGADDWAAALTRAVAERPSCPAGASRTRPASPGRAPPTGCCDLPRRPRRPGRPAAGRGRWRE
jgi:D-inositol-3-phosphate glycosyltransferase